MAWPGRLVSLDDRGARWRVERELRSVWPVEADLCKGGLDRGAAAGPRGHGEAQRDVLGRVDRDLNRADQGRRILRPEHQLVGVAAGDGGRAVRGDLGR